MLLKSIIPKRRVKNPMRWTGLNSDHPAQMETTQITRVLSWSMITLCVEVSALNEKFVIIIIMKQIALSFNRQINHFKISITFVIVIWAKFVNDINKNVPIKAPRRVGLFANWMKASFESYKWCEEMHERMNCMIKNWSYVFFTL